MEAGCLITSLQAENLVLRSICILILYGCKFTCGLYTVCIRDHGVWVFHLPLLFSWLLQVVRYHSLIIDSEALPKELIPTAWTSSSTHSFLESPNSGLNLDACKNQIRPSTSSDTFSTGSHNGASWSFSHPGRMQGGKVLMGIMHSTRPHYGLQVCWSSLCCSYSLICFSVLYILDCLDLQFHPESIATCHGRQIFENFREITEDYWQRLRPRSTFINERNVHYAGKDYQLIFLISGSILYYLSLCICMSVWKL
jgi:para-aminobenzoate synthetase